MTVSAAEDDNGVDETVSLTHTASGGGYGSLMAAARPGVSVTADDNDTPGIELDAVPSTPTVVGGALDTPMQEHPHGVGNFAQLEWAISYSRRSQRRTSA